ncbi:MAG: molybdenum ABC transporter permease [Desulfobacterales bacterium SG8_35_2]|nr:MAG: molybdenum ABC transporter permease [Desulfobacterales bacterium SG8_35_2]
MDLQPLYLSAKLAFFSTTILMLLVTPVAYVLAYFRFRGKVLVDALISLPLVLPPTVLGFYLLVAMGPKSPVGQGWQALFGGPLVFSFAGIVIASMLHSLPYAAQPLKAAFEKIDKRLLESSYVLGVSPIATFFRVVLPNSIGGLAAAAILAFAHTMGEFGVILMVGGSIPGETKVASIAVFELVESLKYKEAWALSLALMISSYLVLLGVNFINSRERS